MGKVLDIVIRLLAWVIVPRNLAGNEGFLQTALIEIPPYGRSPLSQNTPCTLGRLANTKEWFVTKPAVVLLNNVNIISAWEDRIPHVKTLLQHVGKEARCCGGTNERI
jgi:hypothetical protein